MRRGDDPIASASSGGHHVLRGSRTPFLLGPPCFPERALQSHELFHGPLFAKQGYPSLFDYCTQRLGLSEGSVWLRIQVAKVARRFPQVLAAIADGRLSLTVAGQIAGHLTEENADDVIRECAGMSKRAVAKYLVRFHPKRPASRRSASG